MKELFGQKEIFMYLVIGVLTTVVGLVSFYISIYFLEGVNDTVGLQIANVFSWVCATSFAYIGNRKVVYKSDSDNIRKEILRFMVLRLSTLVLDMFIMFILVTCIHANDMISKFISIFMITLTNYLFGKYIVFKKDIYR